jgi:cold-inducible RNA-binding protein
VTNVFVGNLDIAVTERQLRELFAAHGVAETITVVKDRDTGEPRGIAFVKMTHATEAQGAISALDKTILNGRAMNVNEARPKLHRDPMRDSDRRIIGDRELRTRQLPLDRFSARKKMSSL